MQLACVTQALRQVSKQGDPEQQQDLCVLPACKLLGHCPGSRFVLQAFSGQTLETSRDRNLNRVKHAGFVRHA